jgi:hypothetical protein
VAHRTWIFVLAGTILVAAAGFLLAPNILDGIVACYPGHGGCQPNRTRVLGVRLSDNEVVVWGTVVGAMAGALLGPLIARVTRRVPAQAR